MENRLTSIIPRAAILLLLMMLSTTTAWAQSPTTIGSISINETLGAYDIKSTANLNDLAVYVNGMGTYSTGGEETEAHNCEGMMFKMTADITYTGTATTIQVSGTCGDYGIEDNVTWAVTDTDGNGSYETLTISGTGATKNYSDTNQPWAAFKSDITTIVIGDGVTRIGGNAFYQFTALTSVTIAPSVTTIGNAVFFECTNLTTVSGASGVTYVDSSAFDGTAWKNALPDGLTSVGHVAYRFVGDGTSVNLGAATTQIYEYCFQGSKITSIVIPASVERIGEYAFANSALQKMYVLRSGSNSTEITQLGNDAFSECSDDLVIVVPTAAYSTYSGHWYSYNSKLQRGYTVTCGTGITATSYAPIVAQGETVTLSGTVPEGCSFGGYIVNGALIEGNTFTMNDQDVTVTPLIYTTGVDYMDWDGTAKKLVMKNTATDDNDANDIVYVLDGTDTELAAGWYICNSENLSYTGKLNFNGDAHLILADGCNMTVTPPINTTAINNEVHSLTIYGQSTGDNMGALTATCVKDDNYYNGYGINAKRVTINGGKVSATGKYGIRASSNDMTINGGKVVASALGNNDGVGILSTDGNVTINGGQVTATGSEGDYHGIASGKGDIILGWTNPTDFIKASSYHCANLVNSGKVVKIADGKILKYTDGGNTVKLMGTSDATLGDIKNITLTPYGAGGYCGKDDTSTTDVDESKNLMWDMPLVEGALSTTMTISGTGDMADYTTTDAPWKSQSVNIILVSTEADYTAYAPSLNATDKAKLAPQTFSVAKNASGWSTYCHSFPVSYSLSEGATAYTVKGIATGNDGKSYVDISEASVEIDGTTYNNVAVPRTPLLLNYSGEGSVTLTAVPETAKTLESTEVLASTTGDDWAFYGNASNADIDAADATFIKLNDPALASYVLRDGQFVRVDTNQGLAAHRCLLNVGGGSNSARTLIIGKGDGDTTGIGTTNFTNADDAWYDLQGRKVNGRPTHKGVYIQGNKKRVIR